jgi:predicted DNA-binding transcriptional regulator AlpA
MSGDVNATAVPVEDRFLRVSDVTRMVCLCRQTIWKLQRQGAFPKAYKLTPKGKSTFFRSRDIQAWMDSRPLA